MKGYHIYFFILKFFILLLIILMSLKIILIKDKLFIIINFIFKLSFGIFIILYFTLNKNIKIDKYDRLLMILSGFILIILIDYIQVINTIFNLHIKDDNCICES